MKVMNEEKGYSYVWDLDTFQNRYYMIKDVIEDLLHQRVPGGL